MLMRLMICQILLGGHREADQDDNIKMDIKEMAR
jgi:hypothetical protein